MWKMIDSESLKCRLCPTCDSLGPHLAMEDEETGETLLNCIDCDTLLGRLMPLELESQAAVAG